MTDIEAFKDCPKESAKPLTVSAKVSIREDAHEDFSKWYNEMQTIQKARAGYLSSELIRPVGMGNNEYISIFRYDSYEHLQQFLNSKDRLELVEKLQPLLEGSISFSYHSLEFWFEHEGEQANQKKGPPPKWKMSIVTIVVIFILLQIYPRILLLIAPNLHPLLATLINLLFVVPTSTYIVMPIVTRLLSFWLFPGANYSAVLKELIPSCFRKKEADRIQEDPDEQARKPTPPRRSTSDIEEGDSSA